MRDFRAQALVAALLLSASLPGRAEVVFDGTTGGPTGVLTGDITIAETDGLLTQSNDALLHSFELFNVLEGESVTFSHLTPTINNILLRVTGAQPSLLNGQLTSDANLWLLNPNGVLVGADSSLNIDGTFRANTVTGDGASLILNDGTAFSVDTNLNTLAVARPADFGFITDRTDRVVADESLGTIVESTPQADGQLLTISGGSVAGTNLFHSFDQFSVFEGDAAEFTAPAGLDTPITNLISRVTGGSKTFLTGTVRTLGPELAGASFWMVNPAGMFVGNGVQLDVARGLHLGTGDAITAFAGVIDEVDQFVSFGIQSSSDDLFTFNPSFFSAFDLATVGDLTVNGLGFNQQGRSGNFFSDGVSFFGRNVSIANTVLNMETVFERVGSFLRIDALDLVQLEDFRLTGSAVNGANVGGVFLSGRSLLANRSTLELRNSGGNVDFPTAGFGANFSESVSLKDTLLTADTSGMANSGNIIFNTPRFNMNGGATVVRSSGLGVANGVLIAAFDNGLGFERSITLEGGAQIQIDNLSSLSQITDNLRTGSLISLFTDGDVTLDGTFDEPVRLLTGGGPQTNALGSLFINANNVTANQLLVSADSMGASARSAALVGEEDLRAVFIQGTNSLELSNSDFSISTSGAIDAGDLTLAGSQISLDGVKLASTTVGDGDAGAITIGSTLPIFFPPDPDTGLRAPPIAATTTLDITDSVIAATTETAGSGGDVFLNSSDSISLDQVTVEVSSSAPAEGGAAGQIRVLGQNQVQVTNESKITATTESGAPGFIGVVGIDIDIENTRLETDSASGLSGDPEFFSIGISTDLNQFNESFPFTEYTPGTNGPIQLTDSLVSARVSGAGDSAGVLLEGFQVHLESSTVAASTQGAGNAGEITFRNGREITLDNSSVTSSSTGQGAASRISLTARLEQGPIARQELVAPDSPDAGIGRIDIVNSQVASNTAEGVASELGIVSDTVRVTGPLTEVTTNSTGSAQAGRLVLFGSTVSIDGGASVESTASGTGDSNGVFIGAFNLSIGSQADGDRTSVATNSLSSQGGDVSVRSLGLAQIANADLVASAGAEGSGGNVQINVDGGELLVSSSTLLAQADNGDGGVIDINPTRAAQIFIDGQSVLNADSAAGTSGSVVVDSPDTGIVSALSQQEAALAPQARLEQDACNAASQTTSASSLYIREAGYRDPFSSGYLGASGRSQSAQGDCR